MGTELWWPRRWECRSQCPLTSRSWSFIWSEGKCEEMCNWWSQSARCMTALTCWSHRVASTGRYKQVTVKPWHNAFHSLDYVLAAVGVENELKKNMIRVKLENTKMMISSRRYRQRNYGGRSNYMEEYHRLRTVRSVESWTSAPFS